MSVYASGNEASAEDHVSVYFGLLAPPANGVVARYRLRLVNSNHTLTNQQTWITY